MISLVKEKQKEEYDKIKATEKKQIYINYIAKPDKKKKGKQKCFIREN